MKPARKTTYKVTCVVQVQANNARHAAHIAKGVMQMKDDGPTQFRVEEQTITYGNCYSVDLEKKEGEPGYLRLNWSLAI
jgi:hypothetical protein